jgi:hypothetical protein
MMKLWIALLKKLLPEGYHIAKNPKKKVKHGS